MSESVQADVGRVTVNSDWAVATICLDRPHKHNALTPEMLAQLEQILMTLDSDRDTRVVLLTAVGDRSFCAGADIKRFKALQPLDMWAHWTRLGHRVFDHLAGLRQPTIAAVSGNAYGGGFELALACDLRILAEDATLGLTEVGIGTLPGLGWHRAASRPGRHRPSQGVDLDRRAADRRACPGLGYRQPADAQGTGDRRRPCLGQHDRRPCSDRCTDGQAGH